MSMCIWVLTRYCRIVNKKWALVIKEPFALVIIINKMNFLIHRKEERLGYAHMQNMVAFSF